MDKKSLENVAVNEILAQAFTEAALKEFEDIEEVSIKDVLSEKNLKIEKQAYKKYERSKHPKIANMSILKKVAGFVIVLGVISAIMFSIPTVRAGFVQLVSKAFDGFVVIKTDNEENASHSVFTDYALNYIPEGFTIDQNGSKNPRAISFVSEEGGRFTLKAYTKGNFQFVHDTDQSVIEEVEISGNVGYLCYSEFAEDTALVWSDERKEFLLIGNISHKELLKIAKYLRYLGE